MTATLDAIRSGFLGALVFSLCLLILMAVVTWAKIQYLLRALLVAKALYFKQQAKVAEQTWLTLQEQRHQTKVQAFQDAGAARADQTDSPNPSEAEPTSVPSDN